MDKKLTQYLTKANAANAQKVLDLTHKTVGDLVKRELTLSRLSFQLILIVYKINLIKAR